jgi:hypothetical protein
VLDDTHEPRTIEAARPNLHAASVSASSPRTTICTVVPPAAGPNRGLIRTSSASARYENRSCDPRLYSMPSRDTSMNTDASAPAGLAGERHSSRVLLITVATAAALPNAHFA